ncbi:MAG: GNAT family N-acetyltransferase [Candidatus Thorarchaeota archaeon]
MTTPIIEWTSPDKARAKEIFKSVEPYRAIISGSIEHGRAKIHVDSIDDPKVGWWSFSFLNAVAGNSHSDLAKYIIEQFPYMMILCVPDKSWEDLVRSTWGEHLYVMPRTRLSEKTLDINHLRQLKNSLPEGFTLQQVDRESLENLADRKMAYHITQFFGTPEDFLENGFGFCIKHGEKVVSMASTFTPYSDAIEIEIETFDSPEYRRKGLATVVGAALLEYALDNGITPYWDAQTQISVKLALKLGYTNPESYELFIRAKPEDKEKIIAALE